MAPGAATGAAAVAGTVSLPLPFCAMDFARILEELGRFLEERGHPWALIGGLGLAAYGIARTTIDVDLVTVQEAQEAVVAWLQGKGFETLHRSAGYSNHLHPDAQWGRVDLVYVGGSTREKLFAGTRWLPGPRGLTVPVPRPEHLAAMKVLAMKNDPDRTLQELADIRALLTLPDVDRQEVRGYFERHGLAARYDSLDEGSAPHRAGTGPADDR